MRSHMVNRIINRYLLHNRSIMFDNDSDFDKFMDKRKDINQAKDKQPSSLNVKSNLDKLSHDDMQVFRFNFRHETKRKFSIFMAVIIRYNPHHFIGDLWTNLHLVRFMKLCCQFILKHQNTIFKTHLKQSMGYINLY